MKVFIKGLNSCAMRKQNLLKYRDFLEKNGHLIVERPEESDIILVWTCAFRGDVAENSLVELERYTNEYDARVIAAGCLPDILPSELHARFKGKIIAWNGEEEEMERVFGPIESRFLESDPVLVERSICRDAADYRRIHEDADVTFHDQFIKLLIAEGCPFACAYCTEKLMFPAFRSFPVDEIVSECRRVVRETGETRVILLADCLGEYGRDTGTTLPELIRALNAEKPTLSFALNNLHPRNFLDYSAEIECFLRLGWICHLNLPIQSAADKVLVLMDRHYTQAELDRLFEMLARNGFDQFDTHIIVGFPGEKEADFQQTVDFILRHSPKYVLMSKYYEAPGAPAAALPDKVSDDDIAARVNRAHGLFSAAGIICNWEGSDLGEERLKRLNG